MNPNTSKKRIVGVSVLVLLILAATAVIVINPFTELIEKQKASETEEVEDATVSVTVQELKLQNLQNVIQGNGNVIDPSSIDVYPEVAGTLTSLLVKVGEQVEKDQIIGTVDPSRAGMVYKESIIKAPASGMVLSLLRPGGCSYQPGTHCPPRYVRGVGGCNGHCRAAYRLGSYWYKGTSLL